MLQSGIVFVKIYAIVTALNNIKMERIKNVIFVPNILNVNIAYKEKVTGNNQCLTANCNRKVLDMRNYAVKENIKYSR